MMTVILLGSILTIPLVPERPASATDPTFYEDFESDFSQWSVYNGLPSTPTRSSDQAHTGEYSYKVDEDTDAIVHVMESYTNKVVSVWFYDDASKTGSTVLAFVDKTATIGLGVVSATSTTHYSYRIGNTHTATNISRTTGWHNLVFDYRSGTGVTLYIDEIQVAATASETSFNRILLGDIWSTDISDMYFDDIDVLDELPWAATDVWFSDGFEHGFGNWISGMGTPITSAAQQRNGTYSYMLDEDYDSITHALHSAANKVAVVWFYDDAGNSNVSALSMADDGSNLIGLGVSTTVSASKYVYRIGTTTLATSVDRTTGWHSFVFDYRSGTAVTLYIDGKQVSQSTNTTSFTRIYLGDAWAFGASMVYFDDVSIQDYLPWDPPLPHGFSFHEGFEYGFSQWATVYGTATSGASQNHEGLIAYELNEDLDTIQYSTPGDTNKVVVVWFYDDASDSSLDAFAFADRRIEPIGIGVHTLQHATQYVYRIGNTFASSGITRTTGWHSFVFDYRSGIDVSLYLDNTLLATTAEETSFHTIAIGDYWNGSTGDVFFDDISIQNHLPGEPIVAKTRRTLYTDEKVLAARNNIANYVWANNMKDHAVAQADHYLAEGLDFLWNLVPPQSLPRSYSVNQTQGSPITGTEVFNYGIYPYTFDPIEDPWKITDPSSGYKFPTNDFQSYYESGLNANGIFDRSLADPAYLVNTLYPEKGPDWGVDDGLGWIDENGNYYTFIAYYVHWGLWGYNGKSAIQKALNSLRDAYIYTDDVKYARAGTVLLDRIADVYPSLDVSEYGMEHYYNSWGSSGKGKAVGNIWEPELVKDFIKAYDAFYSVMDDPDLIDFLTDKAQTYALGTLKSSGMGIRKNIETGIIEQIYPAVKAAQIASNNGIHQTALALAAVVYDKFPETKTWLDFNFKSGELVGSPYRVTGGNMGVTFVNGVDRDGVGQESSAGYNQLWLNAFLEYADIMDGYDGYTGADLYENAKFKKMFSGLYPLMLGERYTANIGDASRTGNPWLAFSLRQMIKAFEHYGDPLFAQLAYFKNNNSIVGMHGDLFSEDPLDVVNDIQQAIDNHGLLKLDSVNMSGYGFAALRDGENPPDNYGIRYSFQEMLIASMTTGTGTLNIEAILEFDAKTQGDAIAFTFNVPATEDYELLLKPARSLWNGGYGEYLIKLDGQAIGEMDFYGSRSEHESLGVRQLGAGSHTMEFVNTGKNELSVGYKLGLLELSLLDEQARLDRNVALGSDTRRDLWMYYGRNYGHGHADTLNIGLVGFGLDLSPDLGYPNSTLPTDTHFTEWVRATVAHNTVVVDKSMQTQQWVGDPRLFDDRPMVKLIEVEAPDVYPQTELYRRTSAMIQADAANSYVVDFFRIKGGNEHVFSFHGAEGEAAVEGLDMTVQPTGTYAGPDIPYGQRPVTEIGTGYQYTGAGFHYLKNVERDTAPASPFSVDWAIEDTWGMLEEPEDIHLRLTMLNDTREVALADGVPPQTGIGNPESLRYMLAKRSTTNTLVFKERDNVAGPTSGYWYKQALIDGTVVWEQDVSDPSESANAWHSHSVDITNQIAGKSSYDLQFRLVSKQGVGNYPVEVYWDDVAIDGVPVANPDFEQANAGWTYSESGTPFAGVYSTTVFHAGAQSLNLSYPANTLSSANDYAQISQTLMNFNSNFTSVIEPYKNERFISAISAAVVESGNVIADDMDVRAVKVTLENGRVDYIVSALDPDIVYTIDDKLQFKGSFGVYSELSGQTVYSYVSNGTIIGKLGSPEIQAALGHVQGTIIDFTRQLLSNNEIIVDMNLQGYAPGDLVNRIIYVDNDGLRNAVYFIKGVTDLGNGTYSLDLGNTTLIRSYKNDNDFNEGFIYDIAEDAGFRIPLSYEWE